MVWDKTKPTGSTYIKNLDVEIPANWDRLEERFPFLVANVDKWAQQFNNLLKLGGFPSWSAGVDGVAHFPDGWSAEGTPTNFKQETADIGYGKFAVRITTDAVNEGQKETLSGLKPSTKYTIWGRGKATAGDTARLFTTGATTNIDEETASTSWADLIGTFTTDGSGTNVVVKLVGKASGDIVWFCAIVCIEGTIAPTFAQHHNDEHLKAIDYQDAAAANYDYGLLRMECGTVTHTATAAQYNTKAITFGTAFSKILAVLVVMSETHNELIDSNTQSIAVSGFTVLWHHTDSGSNLTADWGMRVYWIAIGI